MYFIKLRHGVCYKGICVFCDGCLPLTENIAQVKSIDIPCLRYNFSELIDIEYQVPNIFVSPRKTKKNDLDFNF